VQDREATGEETEASDSSVTRCVYYAKASKMRKRRKATGNETEASDFSVTRCVCYAKVSKMRKHREATGKETEASGFRVTRCVGYKRVLPTIWEQKKNKTGITKYINYR
jgi:hypothetical protein